MPDLMTEAELRDLTPAEKAESDPTSEELSQKMGEEIAAHETESGEILDKVKDWDELWRCTPTPIDGAPEDSVFATTSVMEFFRDTETVHSSMTGRIFGKVPFYQTA